MYAQTGTHTAARMTADLTMLDDLRGSTHRSMRRFDDWADLEATLDAVTDRFDGELYTKRYRAIVGELHVLTLDTEPPPPPPSPPPPEYMTRPVDGALLQAMNAEVRGPLGASERCFDDYADMRAVAHAIEAYLVAPPAVPSFIVEPKRATDGGRHTLNVRIIG